ncbi:MAG: tetratricopeptide repeat protein [Candidatus Omnitrophica bacterium]|nr:tetratricopeptide repeat protein [Candidatus Omnitrophota bacterium]
MRRITGLILLTLLLALTAYSQEDKFLTEDVKKGIYQFRQENYDEALVTLKTARAGQPDNPLAAYYLGLTYKRMENYVESSKELEASLTMTPRIKGALIELIDCLYRLDRLDDAKKWIKVAEDEGIRPAQAAFLKGLTLLRSGDYQAAIESLTNAKGLDPELTASADYQIGVAHLRLKNYSAAKDVFKDIVSLDPNADVAVYANRYLDALERKTEAERPLHLFLRFAFESDSNVILKPADTSLITNITDQHDTREVWDFKGDYTWKGNDTFSVKYGYGLHYALENQLTNYNILGNLLSVEPRLAYEKVMVSFPANVTHYVVDDKNYLAALALGNMNNFLIAPSQMAQLGGFYKYKNYLRPPFGDEDRTGNELIGTAGWFLFFMNNEGFLNARYAINQDWAEGNNWEYFGNRFDIGFLTPILNKKLKCGANGELFIQNFENVHTVYLKKRRDYVWSVSTLVSYEFIKNTELQFQYTYVNDRSNINIYDYRRHVVTGAIQYKF